MLICQNKTNRYAGKTAPIEVLAVLSVDSTTDKKAADAAIALGVVVDPLRPWSVFHERSQLDTLSRVVLLPTSSFALILC